MKVVHGSTVKNIKALVPQYFVGNNGSQDGIGVNLTNNVHLALNYATKEGSLYVIDLNTDGFLNISSDARLTEVQKSKVESLFNEIEEKLKYRLASDICGKNKKSFLDEDKAEAFYKEQMNIFKNLDLGLDRLKPKIDFDEDGNMVIVTANKEFNFDNVSTDHLHYCLNLYDNLFATNVFKKISSGLILEREGGSNNYLSFRYDEPVMKEITGPVMIKDNLIELVEKFCKKKDLKLEGDVLEI